MAGGMALTRPPMSYEEMERISPEMAKQMFEMGAQPTQSSGAKGIGGGIERGVNAIANGVKQRAWGDWYQQVNDARVKADQSAVANLPGPQQVQPAPSMATAPPPVSPAQTAQSAMPAAPSPAQPRFAAPSAQTGQIGSNTWSGNGQPYESAPQPDFNSPASTAAPATSNLRGMAAPPPTNAAAMPSNGPEVPARPPFNLGMTQGQPNSASSVAPSPATTGGGPSPNGRLDPRIAAYISQMMVSDPAAARTALDKILAPTLDPVSAAKARQALEMGEVDLATKRRELDSPKQQITVLPADSKAIITDPRAATHQVIENGNAKVDSTTRKAIYEAQDELPNLQGAIDNLREAGELLPKIYTGIGADTRSNWNQAAPSWLPNMFSDPEKSAATQRYNQLMNAEAINSMSQTLKGATTDNEMKAFVKIMNDPSTSVDTKRQALKALTARAHSHYQNKLDRINELGGRVPNMSSQGVAPDGKRATPQAAERRQLPDGRWAVKINGQWFEE